MDVPNDKTAAVEAVRAYLDSRLKHLSRRSALFVQKRRYVCRVLYPRDPYDPEMWGNYGSPHNQITCANWVVKCAKTDPAAWEAAKELAAIWLERDLVPPGDLRWFTFEYLTDRRPQPKNRVRNDTDLRNPIIARAVFFLTLVDGISATKNESTEDKECACDMVAEIMKELGHARIGYATVKKAWEGATKDRKHMENVYRKRRSSQRSKKSN